jgi:hypothetical protein
MSAGDDLIKYIESNADKDDDDRYFDCAPSVGEPYSVMMYQESSEELGMGDEYDFEMLWVVQSNDDTQYFDIEDKKNAWDEFCSFCDLYYSARLENLELRDNSTKPYAWIIEDVDTSKYTDSDLRETILSNVAQHIFNEGYNSKLSSILAEYWTELYPSEINTIMKELESYIEDRQESKSVKLMYYIGQYKPSHLAMFL